MSRRDALRREKCRREMLKDRRAWENGARIEPAKSEYEVACFLWGEREARRLYPQGGETTAAQ